MDRQQGTANEDIKNYSRMFRWLGLCIDYYSDLDEEDDDRSYADEMRRDPSGALDALVQIRMSLITHDLASVEEGPEGNHKVTRESFRRLFREYPPTGAQKWWPVWSRFLEFMDDREWDVMWIAVDTTIHDLLRVHSKAGPQIK